MADPKRSEKSNALDRDEHISKGDVSAKRVALYRYDSGSDTLIPLNNLSPGEDYDYLDVQQTDSDTETYVFKTGGSGGTTVRTIVVNYTSPTKSDIDNVTWS